MKLTITLISLASLTTSLTTSFANPPSKSPPNPINHAEARKICNRLPTQARREICLRAIADPRHPPRLSERDGGPAWVDALPEYHSVGVLPTSEGVDVVGQGHHGGENEHEGLKTVKLPDASPDQPGPWLWVPKHEHGEVQANGQDWLQAGTEKRDVQVTEEGNGVLDLAIPVHVPGRPIVENTDAHAEDLAVALATPTTLLTHASPQSTSPPPLTYAQALTLAASPTLAVHKTISTATLSNGTEIRLEQTESATHDVHLEETERRKGEPEEDRVVVHVKVFVQHLRERAQRARRWLGV